MALYDPVKQVLDTLHRNYIIGVGAGPASPVLARPLSQRFNEIHYRYL